jgi:hypothetical protein
MIAVESQPGQIVHEILSGKASNPKRSGIVIQEKEHLRSKHEALSVNSSTAKKEKESCYEHYCTSHLLQTQACGITLSQDVLGLDL